MQKILAILLILGVVFMGWTELVAAAQNPEAEPLARVTIRPNPFVADQAMDWSLLGDFTGTGPLDGATTDNDVLIIVSALGQYKIITDGQDTTQWDAAWSSWAVPAGCTAWGTDVEVIAIATDGTDVQVFARRTSAPWYVYVNETNDDGSSWNGWVQIGTSTYTNGAANYVIGAAVIDTIFLRHYETTEGICIEAFHNEGAAPWTRYELETNLQLQIPPPSGGLDVVSFGYLTYVYIGALHRDYPDVYGYRIYSTIFHEGSWGPVDYLMIADVPDVVDSSESLFAFHIGSIYGLTYDARDVVAPAIEWEDGFEGYEDFWLKVADFEVDEAWSAGAADAVHYVEAARGLKIVGTGSSTLAQDLDLDADGRFTDDDYICVAIYLSEDMAGGDDIRVGFQDGMLYAREHWQDLGAGWHYLSAKRSDFDEVGGGFDWSDIDHVVVTVIMASGTMETTFDDIRLVKADPDISTTYNDTGVVWDFPDGEWHVYEEDDDPTVTSLGQIDVETGVEKFAIRRAWPQGDDYQIVVPIKAKRDDGLLGIAFRMTDTTPSSEDGYILVADTTNNLLRLYRMDAGVKTELDNAAYVFNLDTWYYLGVRVIDDRITGFCSASEDTLFDEVRVLDTDSTHTTGQIGVMSQDTVARFDSFSLTVFPLTEERKGLHMAPTPDIWPAPVLYEMTGYTYPRERVVYLGDYWYAFDESDASFVVVQALSPTGSGADEICPAETVTISLPIVLSKATSSQADVALSNVYGEFDDNPAYDTGSEIQIEGGYKWHSGEEYAYLFTGIINRISESFADNTMRITAYDYVYKLKKWAANRLFQFKSQFKVWLNLREEDHTKHLVDAIEGFTYDSTNRHYRSNTPGTENMVLHGECFNDVAVEARAYFAGPFTNAWFGIVLRAQPAETVAASAENCYGVLWNYAANTISIRKKTDGAWGAALASAALNAYQWAPVWIRAEIVHDTIYVWTSANGVNWTYRTSYADTSPLGMGYVGFAAKPATTGAQQVDLTRFTIYAFDTEKTVEYLMTQIATMAGVTSFNFEDEITDDFSGTALDTDKWRVSENTMALCDIFWGRLRCGGGAGVYGYLNSQVVRKSFVLNFRASIAAGSRIVIIFRANTDFTSGYRLIMFPGAVGTARVVLWTFDGDFVNDIFPRVAIPVGTDVDYTLSVQDNFDETQAFISLWMGGRLIFSCCDNTHPTEGYVGVGSYDVGINYFDNFNIDKLDTPVISRGQANYFNVNPGETGDKLIEELATIQNARWFFDGAGTFTAGLLEPEDGVADVLDPTKTVITLYNELYIGTRDRDSDGWISHVRVVANNGIYADAYDMDQPGYRFELIAVNADLSASQCQEIAEKHLEQQQKTGDTFKFAVTPAQLGLTRRMRFHAQAHQIPRDTTSPLKIDQDFIVGAQRITMKREPSPDWDMQIEPEET